MNICNNISAVCTALVLLQLLLLQLLLLLLPLPTSLQPSRSSSSSHDRNSAVHPLISLGSERLYPELVEQPRHRLHLVHPACTAPRTWRRLRALSVCVLP
eukprot:755230-Hanusia_phi.AAC.1